MLMGVVEYEIDLVLLKDVYRGLNLLHFGIVIWHRLVAHERILNALTISTSMRGYTHVDGGAQIVLLAVIFRFGTCSVLTF
jgi:hypothetical protein